MKVEQFQCRAGLQILTYFLVKMSVQKFIQCGVSCHNN